MKFKIINKMPLDIKLMRMKAKKMTKIMIMSMILGKGIKSQDQVHNRMILVILEEHPIQISMNLKNK